MKKVTRTFRIDEDLLKEVDEKMLQLYITDRSFLIERLLREWVEHQQKKRNN